MDKLKFGMIGLNYDTEAGRGWPGARYAPDSIRNMLAGIMNRMEENKLFDVCRNCLVDFDKIDLKDFGNTSNIPHYNNLEAQKAMAAAIVEVMDAGYKPLILGGDHSTTNAGFMAMHEKATGKIGIIDFDAHLDLQIGTPVQGKYSGSSEIRRAIEMEKYDPKNVVEIGPRGYNYPEHYHFIKESGLTIITPKEVFENGAEATAKKVLDIVSEGTDHIYMTVDIDALDMAYALGSGGQEPAGLNHFQLSDMIKYLAPYVDVIDFVEVNPMTDHRELTSHVAANLILDYLAGAYYGAFEK